MSAQLLRSGSSIGANLEEADAAQSKPDFIHKCTISLKEARESHDWLRILQATRKLQDDQLRLISDCNQIVAILTTIVRKATTP
jgi:four helix bundle protein